MELMELSITGVLTVLVSAFVGSYFAGYLRKKGENLATHEDVDKLVTQVAAVTTTTKEIEAKITSDVWDRQKRWELRREVLFEATRRVAEVDEALLALHTVFEVEREKQKRDDDPSWLEAKHEALSEWHNASAAFDETVLFVGVVCGKETKEVFWDLERVTKLVASGIAKKQPEAYENARVELAKLLFAVRAAIRTELGIDHPV